MLRRLRLLRPHAGLRHLTGGVILFCLVTAGWAETALGLDPADYSIETIRERWRARQEQVKSVRIKWKEKRVFRTTYKTAEMWHGDPNSPDGLATIEYDRQMQVDGGKIEYRSEAADAIRHHEAPLVRETYDGKRSQSLSVNSDDSKTGAVTAVEYSYTGQSLPLFPLYWAFRPLDTSMGGVHLDNATILPHPGVIDEQVECVILRLSANSRNERELWLDPKQDLLPRRYVDTIDGIPTIKLDIDYAPDAKLGPLPKSWKFVWLDEKGEFFDNSDVTVVDCAINPTIPPAAFEIEFPPGTRVADDISGTRYVIAESSPANSRWIFVIFSAFFLLVAIVLLLRRSGKSNASSGHAST